MSGENRPAATLRRGGGAGMHSGRSVATYHENRLGGSLGTVFRDGKAGRNVGDEAEPAGMHSGRTAGNVLAMTTSATLTRTPPAGAGRTVSDGQISLRVYRSERQILLSRLALSSYCWFLGSSLW